MAEETPEAAEQPKAERTPAEQKLALIRLMRYWLFGTFVIVFAGTFTYIAMFANKNIGVTLLAGWPIWAITAALCVVCYVIYLIYLGRKFKT